MDIDGTIIDLGIPEFESMTLFQQRELQNNVMSGVFVKDIITFSHNAHSFSLDAKILAITGSQLAFNSVYQGYLGLAPPYSLADKPTSILSQAKMAGIIDY